MLDIKAWLETAGEPVADTCFLPGEAPPAPYVVFLDSIKSGGSDTKILLHRHSLKIERYCKTDDYNTELENLLDAAVILYARDRQWLSNMECYMTIYDLQTDIIEREVI